jgi:hypothetical protein
MIGNFIMERLLVARSESYRAEEIIGYHFSCFYPREDIDSGKPAKELESAATNGRFEGGRVAIEKGRVAILGECCHYGLARRDGQPPRLRESFA